MAVPVTSRFWRVVHDGDVYYLTNSESFEYMVGVLFCGSPFFEALALTSAQARTRSPEQHLSNSHAGWRVEWCENTDELEELDTVMERETVRRRVAGPYVCIVSGSTNVYADTSPLALHTLMYDMVHFRRQAEDRRLLALPLAPGLFSDEEESESSSDSSLSDDSDNGGSGDGASTDGDFDDGNSGGRGSSVSLSSAGGGA